MKTLTKEWYKDLELHELITALEADCKKIMPLIFTNGGTECVAKKDLYTVKTNLNVSERENEINFVIVPDNYDFGLGYIYDGTGINDFLQEYVDRLRIISTLPESILKTVKDKRLLALGYAEEQTKKNILKNIKNRNKKAFDILEKSNDESKSAETGLTIHNQLQKQTFIESVPQLFDDVTITKAEKENDRISLELEGFEKVVFSGAEIIEEESDIENSYIVGTELIKKDDCYEMHFLIKKRDETLTASFYYVTYAFKDMEMFITK